MQHHSPFYTTIRNIEAVEELENRLGSGYKDETTAVIEVLLVNGSILLTGKRLVNDTKKM